MKFKKVTKLSMAIALSLIFIASSVPTYAIENNDNTEATIVNETKKVDQDKPIVNEEKVDSTIEEVENNLDIYSMEDLMSLVGSDIDIYSHSKSLDENSTIEFQLEDGNILKFNSIKSETGEYYFNIKTDFPGLWKVYSLNGKRIKNDNLNFQVYKDIDEFNKINNPKVFKVRSGKNITRYMGDSRINTAIDISRNNFSSANNVIVTNAWKQIDAIAASALAKDLNAPILYVEQNKIPSETKSELERLGVKNIYVIGGTASISLDVEKALYNDIRPVQNVERISGSDRANTALELAKRASRYNKGRRAFIVSGTSESDSLAVSAASAENGCLMFYSDRGNLNNESKNYIANNFSGVYILNGDERTSSSVSTYFRNKGLSATTINGNDSYDLNMKLAKDANFYTRFNYIYLTSGKNSADGIPASPLAAKDGVPLLLVNGESNTSTIVNYINDKQVSNIYIIGGYNSVSRNLERSLKNNSNTDNDTNNNISAKRRKVVELAKQQLGKPYLWGAVGPNKFDCSGLVMYVFKNSIGINTTRTTKTQIQQGKRIDKSQIKPGDLIFFGNPVYHVGICIGNGQYINAEGTQTRPEYVRIRNINTARNINQFRNILGD